MDRSTELERALARIRARIAAAAAQAGRDQAEIELVVVTKTYPASDVDLLAALGVTRVGENRHPEARDKRLQAARAGDVVWHFIGGMQTNKAAAVAAYADVVESVDRGRVVSALSKGAVAAGREVGCLIQVDLAAESQPGRSGCRPAAVAALAEEVAAAEGLALHGVMVVAPLVAEPARAFAALADIAAALVVDHPAATTISAGMSGDLEEAVHCGATHVRVGRAVLGERPPTG